MADNVHSVALPRRVHDLKTWPEPFAASLAGLKNFEIRKDDRGFAVGDDLLLREWVPCPKCGGSGCHIRHRGPPGDCPTACDGPGCSGYTGRELRVSVTHIERWPAWGIPVQTVVMAVREVRRG